MAKIGYSYLCIIEGEGVAGGGRIFILIIITLLRNSIQNIWLLSDEEHLKKRHSMSPVLEYAFSFSQR
jgi:hypothetical protein